MRESPVALFLRGILEEDQPTHDRIGVGKSAGLLKQGCGADCATSRQRLARAHDKHVSIALKRKPTTWYPQQGNRNVIQWQEVPETSPDAQDLIHTRCRSVHRKMLLGSRITSPYLVFQLPKSFDQPTPAEKRATVATMQATSYGASRSFSAKRLCYRYAMRFSIKQTAFIAWTAIISGPSSRQDQRQLKARDFRPEPRAAILEMHFAPITFVEEDRS